MKKVSQFQIFFFKINKYSDIILDYRNISGYLFVCKNNNDASNDKIVSIRK